MKFQLRGRHPPRTWISLCCGLAATESLAMTGRFVPIARMGGKRAVAAHVLEIIGPDHPRSFLLVDADSAIVAFWGAATNGQLPAVAEVIRGAGLDGEELWRAWSTEPPPLDPVKRLAQWAVLQKGNFSGKPVSWTEGWQGIAGFASVHAAAAALGFTERIRASHLASGLGTFGPALGAALQLDLAVDCPEIRAGDLVMIDPPYRGTTGYGPKLGRERVVELAEHAHDAGADVLVHEAEPVLTGGPWRHVELERRHGRGQRTWSAQRHEVATVNFEPRGQRRLFAGDGRQAGVAEP